MAILLLWASPDTDGLTAQIKNNVIRGIEDAGEPVKEIHLNKQHLQSCLACGREGYGTCRSKGVCAISDDFQKIYDEMRAADALVVVTPVYCHDIADVFKALFDRMRRCEMTGNFYLAGKRAFIVSCAGGSGRGVCDCLVRLEEVLTFMKIETVDRLGVERFNSSYMLPAARAAGKVFAENYRSFHINNLTPNRE